MLRAGQGPCLCLEIPSYSARATQSVEHCVVQQNFFRLVGILARTSPAGNAYAPLFFAALNFFKNPRADFCHIASVNCRERGATLIFSLRLLLDSGISVACSLRDRLPGVVTKVFPAGEVLRRNLLPGGHRSKQAARASADLPFPMPQSGTKRLCSFILIVCPAQTILSRSPTSQCPSALFNPTAGAAPRCTVFAPE